MNGVAFGKTLRFLRKQAGRSCKSLSLQIGKAATYVSQLERGLIKNPDYDTCYKLLEFVGVEPGSIEPMLSKHRLINELNIVIDDIDEIDKNQSLKKKRSKNAEFNPRIYARKYNDTKDKNEDIYSVFDTLADTDITRGSLVINNIYKLTQDEDNLDFLCELFTVDYAQLPPQIKTDILTKIRRLTEKL